MAAPKYQSYKVKAGDTYDTLAEQFYGNKNFSNYLVNNGVGKLVVGQDVQIPLMAQNPRNAGTAQPPQVANSQTPNKVAAPNAVPVAPPVTPTTGTVGSPNAPAIPLSTSATQVPQVSMNPSPAMNQSFPQPQGGQMVGGTQAFAILDRLKAGTVNPNSTPQTPAEQEAFLMYQNWQRYKDADAKTLFQAIQTGELTPDPNNVLWRAISPNGQATPAMAQAFAMWDKAVKSGATALRGDKNPYLGGKFESMEEANAAINADDDEFDPTPDEASVSQWEIMLNDALSQKAPTAPNYTQTLQDLRNQYNVPALEQQLTDLDAQMAEMEAQSRQRSQFQMDQPVAMGVIAGRMTETQRQDAEKMDYIARQRNAVANQMQAANSNIQMLMKTKELDYGIARDEYEKNMGNAIAMMENFREARNDELDYIAEQQKTAQTNARANLQTYYNAIMDGGLDIENLSAGEIQQIGKMELQSGMPVGTFLNLRDKNPAAVVKGTHERYDAVGNRFFDVIMQDRYTGELITETISGGFDASKALDMQTKAQGLIKGQLDMSNTQQQMQERGLSIAGKGLDNIKKQYDISTEYETSGPSASANTSSYLANYGAITGPNGSPLWKYGLDIDLKKGDPVYSPVSGEVVKVGNNGGFGLQVQVKGSDGNTFWLSHLDGANVEVGQKVSAGAEVGKGGNSGNTIPGKGGDGSHLDLTGVRPDGSYMSAQDVQKYVTNNYTGEVQKGTSIVKKDNTATGKEQSVRSNLLSMANQNKGKDGKLNPEDYNALKQAWTSQGLSSGKFDEAFAAYINQGQRGLYMLGNNEEFSKTSQKIEGVQKTATKVGDTLSKAGNDILNNILSFGK